MKTEPVHRLFGNQLSHFLNVENGTISYQQKSFVEFLTNSSRKHLQFNIDLKRGHQLSAEYLLKSINLNSSDLAKIVYHVALSKNQEFESMLIQHFSHRQNISSDVLYQMTTRYNFFEATTLTIKLLQASGIYTDSTVLSSIAFSTSVYGNEKFFIALLENGASFAYQHIVVFEVIPHNIVCICRYIYHCGYNYLHVAAQHGNMKIVEYLLEKESSLINVKTSPNRNAFQIAAENGHTAVLRIMLPFNNSLADYYSFYHSALLGEHQAVKLLSKYIKDQCETCLNFNYVSILSTYNLGLSKLIQTKITQVELHPMLGCNIEIDDSIACDTALNAATRNGHLEIVKFLLRLTNETVNFRCLMGQYLSIKNKDLRMFKILYEARSNINYTCKEIKYEINVMRELAFYSEYSMHTKLHAFYMKRGLICGTNQMQKD